MGSPAPDHRTSHPSREPAGTWSRCGCFTVVPFITFLIVGGAILAFLLYDRHLRNLGLEKMTTANRANYELWAGKSIDISVASEPPVPPQALRDIKLDFNRRSEDIYESAIDVFESSPTLYWKNKAGEYLTPAEKGAMSVASLASRLRSGASLTTTETALLAERLAAVSQLLDEAKKLTADPAYAAYNYPYDYSIEVGKADELFAAFALVSAEQQAWPQALDSLSAVVEILRVPPELSIRSFYTYHVKNTAMFMSERTSDTATLHSILKAMNRARDIALHPPTPLSIIRPSGIALIREMRDTGYISAWPKSLGHAINLQAMQFDYDEFVTNRLPRTDSRYMKSHSRTLLSSKRPPRRDRILARLASGPLKPAARRLQFSAQTAGIASTLAHEVTRARDKAHALVEFDFARLTLTRRIAKLEGKPEPKAPEDFAPEYMAEFPKDPFSEKGEPLQYDAAADKYRSVGNDGKPGTEDDVTWHLDMP